MNDKEIKQCFESMSPDAETEARMLSHILAAKEDDSQKNTGGYNKTSPTHTKKRAQWTIVFPVAASLLIVVGIGIFAVISFSSNSLAPSTFGTSTLSGSVNSSENSQDSESPESLVPPSDSSSETGLAQQFPIIESEISGRLYLVDGGTGAGSIVDPTGIGEELGKGEALSEDGGQSHTCTIYRHTSTEEILYAVNYEGDTVFYLAAPFTR